MDGRHLEELIKLSEQQKLVSPTIGGVWWPHNNLSNSLASGNIWGVVVKGEVASYVVFRRETHAIEVDYLVTGLEYQGKGYMSHVFRYLKALSVEDSNPIWLEVSEDNQRATDFYEKLGFVKGVARKNYYKNGQTALIYSYNP